MVVTWEAKPRGYDDKTKAMAIRMVLEGNSFAATGRVLEVNPQTVANWVKAHAAQLPDQPAQPVGELEQVEVDELFTFVGSKKRRST
jgi:transposase-like protein